ncbi:MAG TPA: hypothetical protein PLT70_08150, partial [bacterium]|nr:hypothetical protein [bacterium]
FEGNSIEWLGDTATVSYTGNELKTFTISTTSDLRDNTPADKQRTFSQKEGDMILESGNMMFDALFTMALREVEENSVSQISDWSFNNGNPVDCECFETGEKWKYVWTRDTAYAVDLGLAFVDPARSKNSLLFKISERKTSAGGGNMEIIQDTGSGGSWPVSTDRVSWALGAYETLKYLEGSSYTDFLDKAYTAIKNTVMTDRSHVFDAADGLYYGEQSFLDWREQTYPVWTASDTVHIAMSKTLSTNVLHFIILDIGSKLAELKGDSAFKNDCDSWKNSLKNSIVDKFYLSDAKLFSAMKTTFLNNAAVKKFDLLGQSLAVIAGVADENKAKDAVANYPVTTAGPPVIWPQEPSTRIYHNRGIWPFVTAYALRSAVKTKNDLAYTNAFMSIVRGAALNLSNMENFEFTTLSNYYADNRKDQLNRDLTGPVVNSQRQLWSVAAFISLVKDGIFGMNVDMDSITFDPVIPVALRKEFFNNGEGIQIKYFKLKGKNLKIAVMFPFDDENESGQYILKSVKLDGKVHDKTFLISELDEYSDIDLILEHSNISGTITEKNCAVESNCFAPHAPVIPTDPYGIAVSGGKLAVTFTGDNGVTFNMYRDGVKVAENVTSPWTDPNSADYGNKSYCYSVSAINTAGLESHIANPVCFWGTTFERVTKIEANGFDQTPNASDHGRSHFADWGIPAAELSVSSFTPPSSGTYLVQIEYGSGRPLDTGITSCLKKVEFIDESDSSVVFSGFVTMPHLGADNWDRWGDSSFLKVALNSTKTYKISITDAFNMSYFEHFVPYTGGAAGGGTEVYNRVNLSTIKFLLKDK